LGEKRSYQTTQVIKAKRSGHPWSGKKSGKSARKSRGKRGESGQSSERYIPGPLLTGNPQIVGEVDGRGLRKARLKDRDRLTKVRAREEDKLSSALPTPLAKKNAKTREKKKKKKTKKKTRKQLFVKKTAPRG